MLALAGEVAGTWAIQGANAVTRVRNLFDRDARPHALFDAAYYARADGGAKTGPWPPFLHFLLWGGFEGLKPHPLFDTRWYLTRYPDVSASRWNPLQHYIRFGWREGRSPHPLFDPQWYRRRYPEAGGRDPLVHFLESGGIAGHKPHPLFESAWYLRTYPQARQTGNPLVHYVTRGAAEGANPSPRFDTRLYLQHHRDAGGSGMDALSHMVVSRMAARADARPATGPDAAGLSLADRTSEPSAPAPLWRNAAADNCPVFVVYGDAHVNFIEDHLLPALAAQEGSMQIRVHTLHYRNAECLLSPAALAFRGGTVEGVTDWSAGRSGGLIGFGEAMNHLFDRVQPEQCFLMVNPDSLPMPGCIRQLLATFAAKPAALVEARQWPKEHPKEFDPETGETPWASGAFLLVSSAAFRKLGGFDPVYFLYNEDVDLSWRAWLEGMPVVYEPAAMCAHFTGALSQDLRRQRREQFFSLRNFLLIAYKFFGDAGEQIATAWIRGADLPEPLRQSLEQSYLSLRGAVRPVEMGSGYHAEKIKILGMNLYHRLRQV